MGLESYRVRGGPRKSFNWDGWWYAPEGACNCQCPPDTGCTGQNGTGCDFCARSDKCACSIPVNRYAGDVWIVMEGHPRKEAMVANRAVVSDPSLPSADVLIKEEKYKRLLTMWTPPVYEAERKQTKRVADPMEVT